MTNNNPAARLHSILAKCRSSPQDLRHKPMIQGWKHVFDLTDKTEDVLVMSRVGRVYVLPSQIAAEITRFADLDARLYLGWQGDMAAAFKTIGFNNAFQEFVGKLSDSLMLAIEFCAHELGKRCPEKILDDTAINELKAEVFTLYQEFLQADLPPDLSRYILDKLYQIYDALDTFPITGSQALETAVNAAMGSILTNNKMAEESAKNPGGQKFWKTVHKASLLLDIAQKTYQIGSGIGKLLGGG